MRERLLIWVSILSEWLYPKRCIFCMEVLKDAGADCCVDCSKKVEVIDRFYCPKCGKVRDGRHQLCFDCRNKRHYFTSGRGMFVYDQTVKKSLFGLKFFKRTWIAKAYGRLMADYHMEHRLPEVDIVVPVPLHRMRHYERGYNQAKLLADFFVERLDELGVQVKCSPEILKRSRPTSPQKDLGDKERHYNLIKAFSVRKKYEHLIEGKNILLIDDIYTTGATMDGCSKVLMESGAGKVHFITVAIGDGL